VNREIKREREKKKREREPKDVHTKARKKGNF